RVEVQVSARWCSTLACASGLFIAYNARNSPRIAAITTNVLRQLPSGEWESPGWIDIQINGLAGVNFGDPDITLEKMREVCTRLWSEGVTHFLPTLITDSLDRMEASLKKLAAFRRDSLIGPSLLGFHLEGPFLSPEDGPRGAHPLEYCRLPTWDDFQRL